MALIHCPECQKEVSSVALACPQCAFPYPGRKDSGNGRYGKTLRTCPDCMRVISRQLQTCPHCGAPSPEIDETPEPVVMEAGAETLICPHCGVPFNRRLKARKSVEEVDSILAGEEKGVTAQSRLNPGIEDAIVSEGLMSEPSDPGGRKKKPLWEERNVSHYEWPRHSKPKKGWKRYLLVMLVILLLVGGWAIWELRNMSGLEALVYWNR